MITYEIGLHWIVVVVYALSTILFIASYAWQKERWQKWVILLISLGLMVHSAALGLRWLTTGHGPYLRRYEVFSSDAWVGVLMYLLVQWKVPRLRITGSIIMPASFLLIGLGIMSSPEIRPLPETFKTFWLIVHIGFAKLAYGSCLIATALAVLLIIKNKGRLPNYMNKLPRAEVLDEYSYKFIAFGFFMMGIMIASGAIWANNAWGRYWGWDPVEIWSLISWILYGLYLHLRRVHRWQGVKSAWLAILSLLILIFAIMGVGILYATQHSPYLN